MPRPRKNPATPPKQVLPPVQRPPEVLPMVPEKAAPISNIIANAEKNSHLDIEDMPLSSLADYMRYNRRAREMNKKLKICRYPIKQCPVELHPKERIVFGRNDQPSNPLPVFLSNEMIHFDMKLYPGKTYDLPRCIVDYLARKGTPIWKWFANKDGSKETRVSEMAPRFALRTIYQDAV